MPDVVLKYTNVWYAKFATLARAQRAAMLTYAQPGPPRS
jgi:hypothetical protein